MEKRNSQFEHRRPMELTRGLFCSGSLSIMTRVSLLANEYDVLSVLHGQVSVATDNQICVIHEAMNGCKTLKIHLRIASKCKYIKMNFRFLQLETKKKLLPIKSLSFLRNKFS